MNPDHLAPDVVVVGAGVGGATVASELMSRGMSVLVIESGYDDPVPISTWPDPAAGATLPVDGSTAAGRYPVGRGPGGGTRVSGLLVSLGLVDDYAEWAGGWDGVRARFDGLKVPVDPASDAEWSPVDEALASRLVAFGAHRDDEWWRAGRPDSWGVARYAWSRLTRTTVWRGLARGVPLRAGAPVVRIVRDGETVSSVVLRDGSTVRANRVVLCAGAAATPALLAASGIAVHGVAHDHPAISVAVRPARPRRPAVHCGVSGRLSVRAPGDLLVSSWTSMDGGSGAIMAAAATGSRGTVGSDGRPVIVLDDANREVLDAGLRIVLGAISDGISAGVLMDAPCDGWATSVDDLRAATKDRRRSWLVTHVQGHWHLAGTVAGTVDDHGAVRQARGLWVADAAALPNLPRAGPMASVMVRATFTAEHVASNG